MKPVAAVLVAALVAASPAGAQPEGEGVLISELVVTAKTPGPAWWRVSDADSQVFIMIVPDVSIAGLDWNRSVLQRRMAGANVFILPHDLAIADLRSLPGMAGILVQSPKLLFAGRPKRLKKDPRPIEETMSPDIRARFVAAREKIGQPASRYATLGPWDVVGAYERDYRAHMKLTHGDELMGGALVREIAQLAKRDRVRTETAYKITVPAVRLKVTNQDEAPAAVAWTCLDAALGRIAARAERERTAALAWAAGDVRPLLNRPAPVRSDPKCDGPGMSVGVHENAEKGGPITRMEEAFVRDQAAAVERALKKPGRSVAVLEALSPLGRAEMGMLGRKGVLARLREKGFEVVGPDDIE